MWASDTIHLRKVLYIPLEKTQKSKQFNLALINADTGSSTPAPEPESEPPSGVSIPAPTDSAGYGTAQSNLTIRRVPASQLSYFPPPSRPSYVGTPSSSHTMPRSYSDQSRRPGLPFDFFSSMFSTSPPHSFVGNPGSRSQTTSVTPPLRSQITSLFSALPIAPSTRDTLIARLSMDSSASTPTQGSEEQEHEMDDVGGSSLRSSPSHEPNASHKLAFPEPRSRIADASLVDVSDKGFELRAISSLKTPLSHHKHNPSAQTAVTKLTSPERGPASAMYAGPDRVVEQREIVQTSQLQPSPGMQLPLRARRSKDGYT